jgi:post-segregation antitoxin (ccd killing protein)/DNA-binding transcriptional regulator YdaS (Cro superfamily)
MRDPGLAKAIEKAGGVNALARALGISSAAVAEWRRLPPRRVAAVAALTGLPPELLRPDTHARPGPPGLAETQAPFAAEARELGLDPEAIAAKAVQDAIRAEKARRWQEENSEAIEAWNAWTEANGLPLAKYRMF